MSEIHRSLNRTFLARLACIRHAASVHPEPGSNSPLNFFSAFSAVVYFFTDHFAGIVWFVLFLLLLNCQGSQSPRFVGNSHLLYVSDNFCQVLFQKVMIIRDICMTFRVKGTGSLTH